MCKIPSQAYVMVEWFLRKFGYGKHSCWTNHTKIDSIEGNRLHRLCDKNSLWIAYKWIIVWTLRSNNERWRFIWVGDQLINWCNINILITDL